MKKKIKKIGGKAGFLLGGVSGAALLNAVARNYALEFNSTKVMVNNKSISMQNFYDNLVYTYEGWFYVDEQGQKTSVDSLCDTSYRRRAANSCYKNASFVEKIDTIYVDYAESVADSQAQKHLVYAIGAQDTVAQIPFLGVQNYGTMVIREFVSNDSAVQARVDKYNDEFNCTREHEMQHYFNMKAGMREWNSYSIKFAECCMDEMSASLAQCLAQIKKYQLHNGDKKYLTGRFKFLNQAIQEGRISTLGRFSKKEQQLIAESIFDEWMDIRYDMYEQRNRNRAVLYLSGATYQGIQPDWKRHEALMRKCFTIDGYDFWKYIKKREHEIFERISPEHKAQYASYSRYKFKTMKHFEQMEEIRQNEGKGAFKRKVGSNVLLSKLIKKFGYNR